MNAEGQPPRRGREPAEPAGFAHGVHVGPPLSAYVSTNSGEEERRDEIMGPTARRPWSGGLLRPRISDFGGHPAPGSWSPGPRVLEAALASLVRSPWPRLPQLPLHWIWLFFNSAPSHGALISPIGLYFKIAVEMTVHFPS